MTQTQPKDGESERQSVRLNRLTIVILLVPVIFAAALLYFYVGSFNAGKAPFSYEGYQRSLLMSMTDSLQGSSYRDQIGWILTEVERLAVARGNDSAAIADSLDTMVQQLAECVPEIVGVAGWHSSARLGEFDTVQYN